MKVGICDVCRYEHQRASYARWSITIKNGAERIKLDACEEHKDFFKGKTFADVQKWLSDQLHKAAPRIDLLFKK